MILAFLSTVIIYQIWVFIFGGRPFLRFFFGYIHFGYDIFLTIFLIFLVKGMT